MKTFAPVPVNIAGSRAIRKPGTLPYRIAFKRSLLERFRYFIESTDWDEKFLDQEKSIHKICLGFIILASLYFGPILVLSLLK